MNAGTVAAYHTPGQACLGPAAQPGARTEHPNCREDPEVALRAAVTLHRRLRNPATRERAISTGPSVSCRISEQNMRLRFKHAPDAWMPLTTEAILAASSATVPYSVTTR